MPTVHNESMGAHAESASPPLPAEPLKVRAASASTHGEPTAAPSSRTERALASQGRSVFAFLITGLHFGILQSALFFAAQVYITATFLGYFVVVMAWMGGTILSMRLGRPKTLPTALGISAAAYFGLLLLGSEVVPHGWTYPLYLGLAVIAALPAGTFFREFAGCAASRSLFLHENNGFILGLLLGMFGFVAWGVHFLAIGPLLSLGAALVVYAYPWIALLVLLPGATYLCIRLGNEWAGWTVASAGGLGALAWSTTSLRRRFHRAKQPQNVDLNPPRKTNDITALPAPRLLLALAGANLILLQYFITREFSSIFAASELSILVVAIAYFMGFSVGYAVSRCLPSGIVRWGAAAMFLGHLAILVFVKVMAGLLIDAGYGMTTLVALLFFASLGTSSLYSILLPRIIDALNVPLISAYSWDLAGAIVGTVFMLFLVPVAPQFLWPAYFVILLLIILLLHWRTPWRPLVGVLGLGLIVGLFTYQAPIQRLATEDYYRTRGYGQPQLLFGGNSFYHSIEVIDAYADAEATSPTARISFINGVRYFRHYYETPGSPQREASLSEFTYFLAELPAKYLHEQLGRPLRILIMGGGSLSTISRVAPYSIKTTLVEIDALVVESSKQYWSDINRWHEVANAEIIIDDARHYLRTTDESFDLIINDISAPYYLGTAIMHGQELYELVRDKLSPGGLFSESTQSRPIPSRTTSQSMKILRGVAGVFPHWRVVDCERAPRGRRGYVYSTVDGRLTTAGLTDIMKKDDTYSGTSTYWEGTDRFPLYRVQPFSLDNMETLLTSNVGRITRRLGIGEDEPSADHRSMWQVLSGAVDESNPNHSRLLRASAGAFFDRHLLIPGTIVILLAVTLQWLVPAGLRRKAKWRNNG